MKSDSRLLAAYRAVEQREIEILSCDIFDTLLWRKVPEPTDLFLLLGEQLKEWLIPSITAEGFADLRAVAEQTLRLEKELTHRTTEITLSEIYWRLHPLFVKLSTDQMLAGTVKGIYESDVSTLVNMEVELEKKLLCFDLNILQLLSFAQQQGIPIILVSNTYFDEEHIAYFLENHLSATLYLSCVYGCGKQSGLFRKVIQTVQVAPHKILHIGDDDECDVEAPSAEGIQTLHYAKGDKKFEEIVELEWPIDFAQRKQLLDRDQGDCGMTSLRAKMLHHCSLNDLKREDHFFWKYGATILGPVLFGFVHWIYERCCAMQQNEVFCLMREGKLYSHLIKLFAPFYPHHTIEAKHLWVSRLFITHASMANSSVKDLKTTMNAFLEHFTMEDFCTYLGLDIGKMQKWSSYRHMILEDPSLRRQFILYLVNKEALRRQIMECASAKRERFLKYVSGLKNLSEESHMILVDVGWRGSAQMALHQILDLINSPVHLHGLYLGTTQKANPALLSGVMTEGFLFKGGFPNNNYTHKGCYVLEQTATAETGLGPLLDIGEDGSLVTSPVRIPPKQKKQAECVQKGIFDFFEYAGQYVRSGSIKLETQSEAFQSQLRAILQRSMIKPTQVEAFKFGPWLHEHGPTPHLTQVIGKDAYYERFIKDMLPSIAFKESGLNWPAAYTAKTSKYLTLTSEALWLKTVPPQCFLSEDTLPLKIFLDTGSDFSKKAHHALDLRSNPNRHFFSLVKIFSVKKPLQRILLMFSSPSSLVRIKSLRLMIYHKTKPEPELLTFFETENSTPPMTCTSGRQLDHNTFYSEEHLKLLHTFATESIYQVQLKLCCETFHIHSDSL